MFYRMLASYTVMALFCIKEVSVELVKVDIPAFQVQLWTIVNRNAKEEMRGDIGRGR